MGEFFVGMIVLVLMTGLIALVFRYSPAISKWMKEKRVIDSQSRLAITTMLDYGVEDAGERIRAYKQKVKDAIDIANSVED